MALMSEFTRGSTPSPTIYAIAAPGSVAHARLTEEIAKYKAQAEEVRARVAAASKAMGLPEFNTYFLETRDGKVTNISIYLDGLEMSVRDFRAKYPIVEGRGNRDGSIRFRHNSAPQKRWAELMKGCPPNPDSRDICANAFDVNRMGELDAILGYPGLQDLDGGGYLVVLREGWPTWLAAAERHGAKVLTRPETLRMQADLEEAKAAKSAQPG